MSGQDTSDGEQSGGALRRTFMQATGAAAAVAALPLASETVEGQEETVESIIEDMSVAEKAGQMIQPVVGNFDPDAESTHADVDTIGTLLSDVAPGSLLSGGAAPPSYDPETLAEGINTLQEYAIENTSHGVPFFYGIDAVHGADYLDGATIFPQRHNMGATRDVDTIEAAEQHTADVLEATNCHETFAPTIELQRDPRWGRYFEGISEDPKLLADISAARTRALESNNRVTSTVKHFAGYEVPHNGNDRAAANTSMRDLRETLLPPFEVAIEEGPGMIMVNSGSVNGVPAHASHWLLTEVLREEYGFEGVVISDWNDIFRMIDIHEYFPDTESGRRGAVKAAIDAGLDMVMMGSGGLTPPEVVSHVEDLVASGELSEERIDQSVRRILELKQELGLFEDPYVEPSEAASLVGNDESMETATKLARESMVLLKNEPVTEEGDPVLPLSGDEEMLVTGPGVSPDGLDNRILMQHGGWTLGWQGIEDGGFSEDGPRPAGSTMVEELQSALSGDQLTHVPTTFNRSNYWAADGLTAHEEMVPTEDGMGTVAYDFTDEQRADVESAAADADVAVVVIGEAPHNEGFGDREHLELPETQKEIVRTVAENTADDTPVVGVEYAGSPRGSPEMFEHLDALLYAGQPGSGGGTAIVETLLGQYNPSGRLAFTWPQGVGGGPVHHNAWPGNLAEPLYPFGHGLSYTDFEYSDFSVFPDTITTPTRSAVAVVKVENTGDVPGEHVVEVYNTQSYGSVMHRDLRVLGYKRIQLDPGEKRTVVVRLDLSALEVVPGDVPAFGPKMVEAGEYELALDPEGEMTTTLSIENAGSLGSERHLPGRFDLNDDGELTYEDVAGILSNLPDEEIIRILG